MREGLTMNVVREGLTINAVSVGLNCNERGVNDTECVWSHSGTAPGIQIRQFRVSVPSQGTAPPLPISTCSGECVCVCV